jgi:hypothetical protein
MCLFHPSAAFAVVAVWTGRHYIGPDVLSTEMARHDVVHGQAAFTLSAILAGIIIAAEHLAACQFYVGTRPMNLDLQPDDGRPWQQLLYRTNMSTAIHHHVSFARQEQANSPACGTDIDWFEIGVEHQHRFVHHSASTTGRIILPIV